MGGCQRHGRRAEEAIRLDRAPELRRGAGETTSSAGLAVDPEHFVGPAGDALLEPGAERRLLHRASLRVHHAEELHLLERRADEQRNGGFLAGPDAFGGMPRERVAVDHGSECQTVVAAEAALEDAPLRLEEL